QPRAEFEIVLKVRTTATGAVTMNDSLGCAARAEQATLNIAWRSGLRVCGPANQQVVECTHREISSDSGPQNRPIVSLQLAARAERMLPVRPGNLVRHLVLVRHAESRPEDSQDSVPSRKNREGRRLGDPGTHGCNSENRVVAIRRRRSVLRGE